VLRSESSGPEGSPQKGLHDVEKLLRQTKDAGVDLTWELRGDPNFVGAAVGLVVYRVLQEALANASRHAPGSRVSAQVSCTDEVIVEVRSGAPAPGSERADAAHLGPGTGLIGMADRARSVGGTLEAGPDGDGFLVRASLPTAARTLVE